MEQNTSQNYGNEAINSAFSETIQTRERYEDSPIWIISTPTKCIATIQDQIIFEKPTEEEVLKELKNPTIKTYCTISMILADKVWEWNKGELSLIPKEIQLPKKTGL